MLDERVSLSGGELVVEIAPALGGKLVTLRRTDGDNVLYAPPELPYRLPDVDGDFSLHDTSGFDECFPTVGACTVEGRALPDHGQVWSRPATWRREAATLVVTSELPDARFVRRLRIDGATLHIDYEVTASRRQPMLWSAHPLLAVHEGAQIVLPDEVTELSVEWSARPLPSRVGWPVHDGARLDTLGPAANARAYKVFTGSLTTGACALYDPASDTAVTMRFDAAELPFVGLWVCEGGWPVTRPAKHYTVALEPCTAPVDSLDRAVADETARWLEPNTPRRWGLAVTATRGRPQLAGRVSSP